MNSLSGSTVAALWIAGTCLFLAGCIIGSVLSRWSRSGIVCMVCGEPDEGYACRECYDFASGRSEPLSPVLLSKLPPMYRQPREDGGR